MGWGGVGVAVEDSTGTQRREGVQVIARAAEMLRRLAAEPHGLTLIELSARVGLPRSTAHRIVRALGQEGFVRAAPSGKLRIGPALVGLAVSSRNDIRHEARPYLERLSHELRETVDLAVLDAGEVLFIDQYTSRRTLRIVAEIGARFPVYATANGKALLAALPPEEAVAILPKRLVAITENTVTDRDVLFRELDEARRTGITYDHQEHTIGIAAVGTTVRDAVGAVAAITVVVPAARFHDGEAEISAALLRTRDEIQAVLNGG
jgi:DNA-binding IclR family transcriptional regulator